MYIVHTVLNTLRLKFRHGTGTLSSSGSGARDPLPMDLRRLVSIVGILVGKGVEIPWSSASTLPVGGTAGRLNSEVELPAEAAVSFMNNSSSS